MLFLVNTKILLLWESKENLFTKFSFKTNHFDAYYQIMRRFALLTSSLPLLTLLL